MLFLSARFQLICTRLAKIFSENTLMDRKWWLVIAGCITHAVNTGFSYFGMSAFFPSFEREFGWSRTAISGAFSLARVESGILGPIEGYLTDRLGAQKMLFVGLFICASGFFALSFVSSLPTLYGVIILGIVLGSSLGYNMPISVLIAKVFRERRSLAFGIFRMGPGISGVLVPVVGWMIGHWGWRTAAVASAFVVLLVGFPLAAVIKRIYEQEEAARSVLEEGIWRLSGMRRRIHSLLYAKPCGTNPFGSFRSPWRCAIWLLRAYPCISLSCSWIAAGARRRPADYSGSPRSSARRLGSEWAG
jgi:MFS family permease